MGQLVIDKNGEAWISKKEINNTNYRNLKYTVTKSFYYINYLIFPISRRSEISYIVTTWVSWISAYRYLIFIQGKNQTCVCWNRWRKA